MISLHFYLGEFEVSAAAAAVPPAVFFLFHFTSTLPIQSFVVEGVKLSEESRYVTIDSRNVIFRRDESDMNHIEKKIVLEFDVLQRRKEKSSQQQKKQQQP